MDITASTLHQWGTQLRDDTARASARPHIPEIVAVVNSTWNTPAESDALRLLINLTAGNDANRGDLAAGFGEFWANVVKHIATDRVLLFLTQFVHDTELIKKFGEFFVKAGVFPAIVAYLGEEHEDYANAVELAAEISSNVDPTTLWTTPESFEKLVGLVVRLEEPDEIEQLALAIHNISLVEHIAAPPQHKRLLEALLQVPHIDNYALVCRRLFGASGNLTSMTSYRVDIELDVKYLRATNAYVVAAAAIALGNAITSAETRRAVRQHVQKQDVHAFLTANFNDIVQYQGLHMLNNLLDEELAEAVLEVDLSPMNKALVDNYNYYKEVGAIYFKFLQKLIRLQPTKMALLSIWESLPDEPEAHNVLFVLLPAILRDAEALQHKELVRRLLQTAVSPIPNGSSITYVLDKVTAVGLALLTFVSSNVEPAKLDLLGESFSNNFLKDLRLLLLQLQTASSEHGTATRVLANNTRFVAGVALQFVEGVPGTGIGAVCHELLA